LGTNSRTNPSPNAGATPGTKSSAGYGPVSEFSGTIQAISSNGVSLAIDGGSRSFSFAPHVSVRLADGTTGTLDQIQSGVSAHIYVRSMAGSGPVVVAIDLATS
jgi:hypothetical protein